MIHCQIKVKFRETTSMTWHKQGVWKKPNSHPSRWHRVAILVHRIHVGFGQSQGGDNVFVTRACCLRSLFPKKQPLTTINKVKHQNLRFIYTPECPKNKERITEKYSKALVGDIMGYFLRHNDG